MAQSARKVRRRKTGSERIHRLASSHPDERRVRMATPTAAAVPLRAAAQANTRRTADAVDRRTKSLNAVQVVAPAAISPARRRGKTGGYFV
jgi:hypothetical protein